MANYIGFYVTFMASSIISFVCLITVFFTVPNEKKTSPAKDDKKATYDKLKVF